MESWMGLLPFHDTDDDDVAGIAKRNVAADRKSLTNEGMIQKQFQILITPLKISEILEETYLTYLTF